jgi:hypothetical protein
MFGIDQTLADGKKMQSVTEATTVNKAQILDTGGNPIEQTTYGQNTTKTSEYYLGSSDVYVMGATNGQTGASVMTNSTRTSQNTDYQRVSETVESFPVSGGTASQG